MSREVCRTCSCYSKNSSGWREVHRILRWWLCRDSGFWNFIACWPHCTCMLWWMSTDTRIRIVVCLPHTARDSHQTIAHETLRLHYLSPPPWQMQNNSMEAAKQSSSPLNALLR